MSILYWLPGGAKLHDKIHSWLWPKEYEEYKKALKTFVDAMNDPTVKTIRVRDGKGKEFSMTKKDTP